MIKKTLLVLSNKSAKIIKWRVFQLSDVKKWELYEVEEVTAKLWSDERLQKANSSKGITEIEFKDWFLECSHWRGNADWHTKRLLGWENNWVIYSIDNRNLKNVDWKVYYKP